MLIASPDRFVAGRKAWVIHDALHSLAGLLNLPKQAGHFAFVFGYVHTMGSPFQIFDVHIFKYNIFIFNIQGFLMFALLNMLLCNITLYILNISAYQIIGYTQMYDER